MDPSSSPMEAWLHSEAAPQAKYDSIMPSFSRVSWVWFSRTTECDRRDPADAHSPGHTPGHVSVWIRSRGAEAMITAGRIVGDGDRWSFVI